MKLISWNVNGLRAVLKKNFLSFLAEENPDIIGIQETKMQESQKEHSFQGYHEYWNSADRLGYSGTLVLTKKEPLSVMYGIDGLYNDEGRALTLEFETFYFVCLYSPNSQEELKRLDYRMVYEDHLSAYLQKLKQSKPVIVTGDLNVAHQEIDIKNPKQNERNAGYTLEEREKLDKLLQTGFVDTFRYLHPSEVKYSWWSYRFFARQKNIGWRIDYFLVSQNIISQVREADIYDQVEGSDHAPILLEIDL